MRRRRGGGETGPAPTGREDPERARASRTRGGTAQAVDARSRVAGRRGALDARRSWRTHAPVRPDADEGQRDQG
eukprot:679453-Pleurochrysis_carterae.AAC.1